jgi:hypothetical protein
MGNPTAEDLLEFTGQNATERRAFRGVVHFHVATSTLAHSGLGFDRRRKSIVDLVETVISARLLRERMHPRYPLALIGSQHVLQLLSTHASTRATYDHSVLFDVEAFLDRLKWQQQRLQRMGRQQWQVRWGLHNDSFKSFRSSGEQLARQAEASVKLMYLGKLIGLLMSPWGSSFKIAPEPFCGFAPVPPVPHFARASSARRQQGAPAGHLSDPQ